MKNINEIAKKNLEEFDVVFPIGGLSGNSRDLCCGADTCDNNCDEIKRKRIKLHLHQFQQNLISAFKEMVEELPNVEVETIQGNKRTKVELKAKFTKDLLSYLREKPKHGAGSNCDIDMCPECEKLDNNFSR